MGDHDDIGVDQKDDYRDGDGGEKNENEDGYLDEKNDNEDIDVDDRNDNEDDEHLVTETDHEDLDDTWEYHISCKECGGRPFTQENFERHQHKTGHTNTGETIKIRKNVTFN